MRHVMPENANAQRARVLSQLPLRGAIGIGARGKYTNCPVQAADLDACAVCGLTRAIKI